MAQSMQSLSQYGHAFDTGLIVGGLLAAAALAACIFVCALTGRCACWQRRLAERRYVRAGLRDLEHYLAAPPRTRPRR
jgi:uncharacterized protein (DUF2062 family)